MKEHGTPFVVVGSSDFEQTRLVDAENNFHNSVSVKDALTMANQVGLDLVCFQNDGQPLCKLIDYGKWRYSQDKRVKKKKKERKTHVKEIKFTPVIGEHDIVHKVKHIHSIIDNNQEIKIIMSMRGSHSQSQINGKLDSIIQRCSEFSEVVEKKQLPNAIEVKIKKK